MVELDAISVTPEIFILEVIDPQLIIVINLDRRPDRWAAMQQAWNPEVVQRFVRFTAVDGRLLAPHDDDVGLYQAANNMSFEKAAAEVACRQSWIEAVKQFGPALYFEDDARAGDPWPYGLSQILPIWSCSEGSFGAKRFNRAGVQPGGEPAPVMESGFVTNMQPKPCCRHGNPTKDASSHPMSPGAQH